MINLEEQMSNWQNVIDEMKRSENFNESIVLQDKDESKFTFKKIGDDLKSNAGFDQVIHPTQISIKEQEANMNALLDKVLEFKKQYFEDFVSRHKSKYPNANVELTMQDMLLQKYTRAVMSDAHGDLFSLLSALCTIGFVNVSKNHFLYFNLTTKQFVKREECYRIFTEKMEKEFGTPFFVDIFLEHAESFFCIINDKNEKMTKKIELLNKYIREKNISNLSISANNDVINFNFAKITIQVNKIVKKFVLFGSDEKQKFIINISKKKYCINVIFDVNKNEYIYKLKQCFTEWKNNFLKEFFSKNINSIFYVIPMLSINPIALEAPELFGKFIDLGDCIDRGSETVACLVTYALLSKAMPDSIKCMLGNHEAMQSMLRCDDGNCFLDFINFCIENQLLKPGYIESNKIGDKTIWRSYSHTILTKKHLPKLFTLLVISSFIASMNEEVVEVEKISENTQIIIKSFKNCSKRDFDPLKRHLRNKWPEIFNNLSEELRNKLKNFFKDEDLTKLLLKFFIVNNKGKTIFYQEWQSFYSKLMEFGFTNNEFFELKFAMCSIFYNEYYKTANIIWKNVFLGLAEEDARFMGWLFGERYVPENKCELFDDVIQYLGHDHANFILMPENLGGLVIYLDTCRSAGYRTDKEGLNNESRLNLL